MTNSSSSPMRLLARAVKRHGLRCAAAADCGEGVSDAAVDGRGRGMENVRSQAGWGLDDMQE